MCWKLLGQERAYITIGSHTSGIIPGTFSVKQRRTGLWILAMHVMHRMYKSDAWNIMNCLSAKRFKSSVQSNITWTIMWQDPIACLGHWLQHRTTHWQAWYAVQPWVSRITVENFQTKDVLPSKRLHISSWREINAQAKSAAGFPTSLLNQKRPCRRRLVRKKRF